MKALKLSRLVLLYVAAKHNPNKRNTFVIEGFSDYLNQNTKMHFSCTLTFVQRHIDMCRRRNIRKPFLLWSKNTTPEMVVNLPATK